MLGQRWTRRRDCLRQDEQCSPWGLHSLLGDESYHREVQEPKTLGWIREVSWEQGCQHTLGEILFVFLPGAISLWFNGRQLANWLGKWGKMQFPIWGPCAFARAGALACSLVLAPGERPLRLGHRLSNFSWNCGILALTLQQPILISSSFCGVSIENKTK